MVPQYLRAENYKPFILFNNIDNKNPRQFSGVVINQDDTFYYCLSVNHGLDGLTSQEIRLAANLIPESSKNVVAIVINASQIKSDEPRDLSLIKFNKTDDVIINPLIIGQDKLNEGQECISYGFSGNTFQLLTNKVIVKSYNEHSYKNISLLTCRGPRIFGMSGGPLVHNSKIYGIQSSAGPNEILYTPSIHINGFLRD